MYAESGLLFPYFSQEVQHLEEFWRIHKTNDSGRNLVQTSTITEYDLGGEGDLFKAPEPILEEPMVGLDPMTAAISMISCGEEVISPQEMKATDIEANQSEHLLSELFYECKKDLLAKSAIEEEPLSEAKDVKIPVMWMEEDPISQKELISNGLIQKSVSSGCLSSMEWINGGTLRPNFLDFQGVDFEAAYGMRRAFSEGDIQMCLAISTGCGGGSLILSFYDRLLVVSIRISSIHPWSGL